MYLEKTQTEAKVPMDLWTVLHLALYFSAPYLKRRHQTHKQSAITRNYIWQQNFKTLSFCYFLLTKALTKLPT